MKRYILRDLARSYRCRGGWRYLIAVMRQLGGVMPRTCPICDYHGMFNANGHPPRYDALCGQCGSLERHRLVALFLKRRDSLGRGRVVHFAPEESIREILEPRATHYRTADLHAPGCDLKIDIERADLPDRSVDLFVLNHVLEHVDDRKALAELYRCLAPGGKALITFPVVEGWSETYEDDAIATGPNDADRSRHFGWADHRRFYGADVRDRIRGAGFALEEFAASGEETVRFGLIRGERVFLAAKPAD